MKKLTDWIIPQDNPNIVVINKPAGIAVQSKEEKQSLEYFLTHHYNQKVFACHRIDQVVSGLVLLAKEKQEKIEVSKKFLGNKVDKYYLALVEKSGEIEASFEITARLYHDKKMHKAYVVEDESNRIYKFSRVCTIQCTLLSTLDNYYLLGIRPTEGRFHQIRALLQHHGFPIKGDVKYGGRRKNTDRSIHLHAYKLGIDDIFNGRSLQFVAPLPDEPLWNVVKSLI